MNREEKALAYSFRNAGGAGGRMRRVSLIEEPKAKDNMTK